MAAEAQQVGQQIAQHVCNLSCIFGYMIAVFLGLLGLAILFLIFIGKIDLSGLVSEPTTPDGKPGDASMSRFQFLIFTFVIAFSLLIVIAKKGDFPSAIPDSILALLGISGGSYLISKGIQTSRDTTLAKLPKPDQQQQQPGQQPGRQG
jgi:uncharacterized BrkB/YihY/UPF0761 family membrane protein